jgi:hypothetical protein
MVLSHAGPWRGRATSVRRRSTRQSEPLGLPDLETVDVELNRHPVLDHDSPVRVLVPHHRLTAAVARVPGARNIPVIDSAAFRQAAVRDLAPDYLANKVGIYSRVFADIGISLSISVFKIHISDGCHGLTVYTTGIEPTPALAPLDLETGTVRLEPGETKNDKPRTIRCSPARWVPSTKPRT